MELETGLDTGPELDEVELGGGLTELGVCVETEVTVLVDTVPGADTVVVGGSAVSKV